MRKIRFGYVVTLWAVVMALQVPIQCFAGSVTLNLRRASLTNVNDDAGGWQYEGGDVLRGEQVVAHYAVTRRVIIGGTYGQNVGMLTMTIFFLGVTPPENITLQGSHHYGSGRSSGSVSAASEKFKAIRNATFTGQAIGATGTLTITGPETDVLSEI